MAAQISSTQSAVTVIGASRDDVVPGLPITLNSVDTATTYSWSLVYVPPDSALTPTSFTGSEVAQSPGDFTPDVEGAYLVRLIVDFGLATEDTQYVRLRAVSALAGLKQVAAGETYTGSTIIPVDLTSTGWADDQNSNFKALEDLLQPLTVTERTVTVDPVAGDYQSIQDAINFAVGEGAGLADQWTVLVKIGEYTENLTLEPFVHLVADPGGEAYSEYPAAPMVIGRHTYNGAVGEGLVLKGLRFVNTAVSSDPVIDHQGGGALRIVDGHVEQQGVDASQGDAVAITGSGYALLDRVSVTVAAGNPATTTAIRVGSGGICGIRRCDIFGPTGVIGEAGASVLAIYWSDIEGGTDAIQTDGLNTEVVWSYINGNLAVHPGAGALVQNVEVVAKWSTITGALDYDTTGIVGNTTLRTGSLDYGSISITGALTSREATTNGTTVYYDNGASSLSAENVQDALDEVYVYASQIRSLDDAYDSDLGAGAGRTIIADSGAVDIVDAGAPATTPAAGNTNGSLRVVGFVELGGLGEPEMRLDPNPFGSGAFFLLGRNVNPTASPLGIDTFIMANSTGNPSYRNYNLRLTTKSTDGGGDVGDIYIRGGDGLDNGVSTPNAASVYVQAGSAYGGTADGGDIWILPGQSAGGTGGRVWLALPSAMTAASLTAAGAYVGGVDGDATFATNMGAVTVTVASGDAVGDVVTKLDALEGISASEAAGVITITTDAVGPDAYVYLSQADVGVDAALGGFSGVLQTDGTAPSGIWVEASADQEITFGATGATGPMIYNADTGKLTVPGLIDPTGMIFTAAAAPSTGAAEGGIFVSDGSGGLTAGNLYYREPSNGTINDITTGGGGGGVPEAPIDGTTYGRRNAAWTPVSGGGGTSIQKVVVTTSIFASKSNDNEFGSNGFISSNPYDTSSAQVPSGQPFVLLFRSYSTLSELPLECPEGILTSQQPWEEYNNGVTRVPTSTSTIKPMAGLAAAGPYSGDGVNPTIPPVAGNDSTGYYFEVEFGGSGVADCVRVGLLDLEDAQDDTGSRLCRYDILGGSSPAGDSNNQGTSPPTIAFQSDGTVFTGSTSSSAQYSDVYTPSVGERVGVLVEFNDYASYGFMSMLPGGTNNFKMRAYFYSYSTGSWLNGADPTTGEGAVYFSGGFASGSITFPAPGSLSIGDVFVIRDGLGSTQTYEWTLGGGTSDPGFVEVDYTGAATAEQVRDLALAAVQTEVGAGNISVVATAAGSADTMTVRAVEVGTSYNGVQLAFDFRDGASTPEDEFFVIDDGQGTTQTYRWDSDGSVVLPEIALVYTGAETAEQMRDIALAAVQGEATAGNIILLAQAGFSSNRMDVLSDIQGPQPTLTSSSMSASPFENGEGAIPTTLAPSCAVANDIRSHLDLQTEAWVQGDYLRVYDSSSGIYEYIGYDASYTTEVVIDSANTGSGTSTDVLTLDVGVGGSTTVLVMTGVPGAPGVDEFQIAGTAQLTALALVAAINGSANWSPLVKAEVDPVNDRMVVIKPADALGGLAGTGLDFNLHAHTTVGIDDGSGGTSSLFESAGRFAAINSSGNSGFLTYLSGDGGRVGQQTTKGQRMVYTLPRTTDSFGSNTGRIYAYPDEAAGNNLRVDAFVGDGAATALGTGSGALTGGQSFPELEFFFNPNDYSSTAHIPSWVGAFLTDPFESGGDPTMFPIDTRVFQQFGLPLTSLSLQWDSQFVFNFTGVGRSADIVFDKCTTAGDVTITYYRSDLPYDLNNVETLVIPGPLTNDSSTVSIEVPILRIQSVDASILYGHLAIKVGDLWAPIDAPVGLSSGVPTPATILTDPAPAILITDEVGDEYTFQPAVGGTDGNMVDLYNKEPGSPSDPVPPSSNSQRFTAAVALYYEVENT